MTVLVFDWDGTLCDSTARIVAAMQHAARQCRVEERDAPAVREIIGLGLPEAIAALYPQLDPAQHGAIREQYVQAFLSDDQAPSPLFPGVAETLVYLRDAGYPLAIATGKSRRGLDRALAQLGLADYFAATRCADETRSKPHPQMLVELLQVFAVDAHEAIMVGDTHYDMAMAGAAGMPCVAVSYGAHAPERLLAYDPLACIDRFSDLLAVLDKV